MAAADSYEDSEDSVGVQLKIVDKFALAIYCVIFLIGTIGNGAVIYVTGFKMKKTVNPVWFLNLALADFLFTGFLIFSIISTSRGYNWPFGDVMCKLSSLVSIINMFASIFLLTAISLDRCLSTWVVVWAQNQRTPRKAQLMCAAIWLAALACSLPFTIFREVVEDGGMYYCVYSHSTDHFSLAVLRFVLGFLIPFVVITSSYVAIVIRAQRFNRGRKRRSLRIIIAIILAFFVCWLPFHVFQFLQLKAGHDIAFGNIISTGLKLSVCLAFFNSCLNPILYVFMCEEFQKKLQKSVCHVLESAFAEDNLSLATSYSFSSHLSSTSRKSVTAEPMQRKDSATCITAQTTCTYTQVTTADRRGQTNPTNTGQDI